MEAPPASLGDRMKGYEGAYEQRVDMERPFTMRMDGHAFSKFTKGRQLKSAKAELAKVEADLAKMKSDPKYLEQKNKDMVPIGKT